MPYVKAGSLFARLQSIAATWTDGTVSYAFLSIAAIGSLTDAFYLRSICSAVDSIPPRHAYFMHKVGAAVSARAALNNEARSAARPSVQRRRTHPAAAAAAIARDSDDSDATRQSVAALLAEHAAHIRAAAAKQTAAPASPRSYVSSVEAFAAASASAVASAFRAAAARLGA
jgi:hypothetical protein